MWLLVLVACGGGPAKVTPNDSVSPTTDVVDSAPIGAQNLVLISIDTTRADHLSLYGYHRPTTPELSWYGERAIVFERAISNAPWTKPSMTTVFTSLEPFQHGVWEWDRQLEVGVPTLVTTLKDAGWSTHAIVTHSAFRPSTNRFHVGFDTFDESPILGVSGHDISSAREVTDLAIAALDALSPPYFLWVHHFDPHDTYLPHEDHDFGDEEVDLYDGEIAYTDLHLGRFLRILEERQDAVVVVLADHGEEFRDHGGVGHAVTLYEEQLHVPLMIRVPGAPPSTVEQTVPHLDLAPTLLALADGPPLEGASGEAWPWDGSRFDIPDHRPVFSETLRMKRDMVSLTEGRWKLIEDRVAGTWQLYDLEADPGEQTNLAEVETKQLASLRARLTEHYTP